MRFTLIALMVSAAFAQEAPAPQPFVRLPELGPLVAPIGPPPVGIWTAGGIKVVPAAPPSAFCSIPLVAAKADPNIDPGIFVGGTGTTQKMADIVTPAPVCG